MRRSAVIACFAIACAGTVFANPAPYAGQEAREIKSLSAAEMADLKAGRGMGLAKAAELNGFPGPMHVLELSDTLALTDGQRAQVQASFERMREAAQATGERLLEAERLLDRRFAHQHIDAAVLSELTARIGALQGDLRRVHLAAHLEMKAVLTAEQTARYIAARGYAATDGTNTPHTHKH
jgi:Spy/CpxP family protein refolding chaperone